MRQLILLLLFIPLISFGQDFVKLSENQIVEEMKIVEEIVKDKENQKLVRKKLSEKGKPITGDGYTIKDTYGHPIYSVSSIEEDNKRDAEFNEWLNNNINSDSENTKKLTISIIFSLLLLYLSSRKFKLWIKAPILFFTPLVSAYALINIFNEYVNTFGGMILWAVVTVIVVIYILIQFLKVSSLGTALGLYFSLKSDEDKK
tara:strand:- start:80 stop:685 length:606 start_codon:yes stop_codon:yes gene_type:complete